MFKSILLLASTLSFSCGNAPSTAAMPTPQAAAPTATLPQSAAPAAALPQAPVIHEAAPATASVHRRTASRRQAGPQPSAPAPVVAPMPPAAAPVVVPTTPPTVPTEASAPSQDEQTARLDHAVLDSLLQKYVSAAGKVDYKGLKADKGKLDAYCEALGMAIPDDSWDVTAQMAYWINAYNAFTLKLIVENMPVSSILRLDGGKTWDVKRIRLAGKKYSLNQIENDILRPRFKDARIHFAINCAAKSCPPLHNRAFTPDNLEEMLEARTRTFINDPKQNQLSASKAQISKIFEWYAVDFGDIRTFLKKYADTPVGKNTAVTYREYDWDLND